MARTENPTARPVHGPGFMRLADEPIGGTEKGAIPYMPKDRTQGHGDPDFTIIREGAALILIPSGTAAAIYHLSDL